MSQYGWAPPQVMLHIPQLWMSFFRLTQAPPQQPKPGMGVEQVAELHEPESALPESVVVPESVLPESAVVPESAPPESGRVPESVVAPESAPSGPPVSG